jgi:hypothetical protein
MRIIIILLLTIYLQAKENLFFDGQLSIPFAGKLTQEYVYSDDVKYYSPNFFLNLSCGYILEVYPQYTIEPSIGVTFDSGDALQILGKNYSYDYYDITLPFMYVNGKTEIGIFAKYLHIPSIEFPKKDDESRIDSVKFENKDAYSVGIKGIAGEYFVFYEYLFHGKYEMDYHSTKVNIEGSRIGIGIRKKF